MIFNDAFHSFLLQSLYPTKYSNSFVVIYYIVMSSLYSHYWIDTSESLNALIQVTLTIKRLYPFLLTWINFNPNMDK